MGTHREQEEQALERAQALESAQAFADHETVAA